MIKNLSLETVMIWVEKKRDWCCKYENQGCTTTTTTITVTSTVTTTQTTSTTTSTTFTETTTSTIDGCAVTFCSMQEAPGGNATNATCRHHIQRLSFHMFLGQAGACSKARDFVLSQCDSCSVCPPKQAGCGVLDYAPTTTTTPRPCHEAECVVGGQSATCLSRIKWARYNYPLKGHPDACPRAHDEILKQCSSCGKCTLSDSGCETTSSLDDADDEVAESYDCTSQLRSPRSQWSSQKRLWCCAHKKVGCHETEPIRVLISDFNKDSKESHDLAHGVWSTKVIVGFGAVGFVTVAALFAVASRRPASRELEGYKNGAAILKSVDEFIAE